MTEHRAGFVALIGAPNAGKSTLLNRMLGVKIAGVTHKVQTTRTRLRGIVHEGGTQIIFVDTPGIFAPKKQFERAMVADAWAGVDDADVIFFIAQAHLTVSDSERALLEKLSARAKRIPIVLVINKIDRVSPEKLLTLSAALHALCAFQKSFMISAKRGKGVAELKAWVAKALPHGPWLYDPEQLSDKPMEKIAADITHEKIMRRLHQELPYMLTVEPESWEVKKDGSVRVGQVIYVARAGHRGIVLGQGGLVLKAISQAARADISEIIGKRVHLFLRVKHVEDWQNKKAHYQALGLDFSKGGT